MKAFILGLDGMTLRVIQPYVEEDLLPNFRKIMAEGFHGKMRTSIPPVTGPGWTALTTGKGPGKHGVFEFRKREGYQSRFITKSTFIECEPVWKILSRQGKRVIVINVPLTYPPDEVNGVMISGLMTPGTEAEFTHPGEVKREIIDLIPDYRIDVDESMFLLAKNKGLFLREITKLTEDRRKLMNHFFVNRPWDLFFITYIGLDRIQHFFWDEIMARTPECVRYFQLIDDVVGDVIEKVDEDTALLIVSDHGFTDGRRAFCINSFFREQGLLSLRPKSQAKKKLAKLGLTGDSIKSLLNSFGLYRLKEKLPSRLLDRLKKLIPNKTSLVNEIDWENTSVFSLFGYGLIHVNLAGREPMGIVAKSDYDRLCEFVKHKLLELEDPKTGRKIVQSVFRGTEIYSTGYGHELPDLVLVCNEGFSVVTEFWKDIVTDTKLGNMYMTGNHELDGAFMAYGRIFQNLQMDTSVYDIMPTVLYLMGVGIPENLDGRVLMEIFSEAFSTGTTSLLDDGKAQDQEQQKQLNREERDIIEQRLRSLGYLA